MPPYLYNVFLGFNFNHKMARHLNRKIGSIPAIFFRTA